MSMRVLLVTPPYHAGVVESAGKIPHLGFIYLAGALRAAGHEVEIYDAMSQGHVLEEIRGHLRHRNPQVVGVSVKTPALYAALDLLRVAKEEIPGVITVMGGVHPTFCFRDILRGHSSLVDFVVRGEGEETFPELLAFLEGKKSLDEAKDDPQMRKVRGIAYTCEGALVATPGRPFIQDLDRLQAAWDLVNWEEYCLYYIPGSRLATVSSSRGCGNTCTFCSQQAFWHRSLRYRSPHAFLKEVEFLHRQYGINYFLLTDEYPTADRGRWVQILDGLIALGIEASFLMETCATDIVRDADLMERYRRAGIIHLYVGVEGTKQEQLDRFKKTLTCEQSLAAIRLINEADIASETSFILGVPEETPETIRETLTLAKYYDPDYAHFLMLTPWPFSLIHKQVRPHIETTDLSQYNLIEPVIKPVAMTREELRQEGLRCYQEFYMDKLARWFAMPKGWKRTYLLNSMRAMMEHSFLKHHMGQLGSMPTAVAQYLQTLAFDQAESWAKGCSVLGWSQLARFAGVKALE